MLSWADCCLHKGWLSVFCSPESSILKLGPSNSKPQPVTYLFDADKAHRTKQSRLAAVQSWLTCTFGEVKKPPSMLLMLSSREA